MKIGPVVFRWCEVRDPETGEVFEVMRPTVKYSNFARRQYVLDEEYPLALVETRSRASHNAYFASVQDGYDNLPEKVQARWENANHLRKWVLVELGWYDEKEVDFDTPKDAKKLVMMYREWDYQKPMTERDYARLWVRGCKVIIRTAKSQSAAAMTKRPFEQSKKAVLDYLDEVLGIKPGTLKKQGGRAA